MKKFFSIFFLLGFLSLQLFAQKSIPKPNPPRLVVDNAHVLNDYDQDQLEKKLVALDDSTSNQIVILTVPSLNDESLEDVAVSTFRDWGIGNKKTNNGILIFVAMAEKKIRIEVGYGLEGAIPDVVAKEIIDNDLMPAFRQKNYVAGFNNAVDDLSKAAVGEYKVKRNKAGRDSSGGGGGIIVFFVILFVVLMIVGNSGRGGGGGMASRRGFGNVAESLFWSALMNSGGRGGGDSGWSGGGGGGFGGFGGGSSGGGGASGGW